MQSNGSNTKYEDWILKWELFPLKIVGINIYSETDWNKQRGRHQPLVSGNQGKDPREQLELGWGI